ncbi:hypothetical protein MmiAt1_06160 [Methanimicrococcus sp. At1]|uniref:Uncharacterized protein n=1 Tax=Methanimicrococcus hacksteinii TaxID=3028293 RepID=A0ABU3VNW3_9EURY|nr:hypothetical protein [Methanimicrococcus sp. At1]MDV0445061.1 hypothetical protein [Methanimicrococcus sp. At1]
MNTTEQKLTEMIECQKQLIDIGNYEYYQSAIDVFFYPAERLNIRLQSDLQALRAELLEDSKTNPPFVKVPISKYNERIREVLNYYIEEGKFLGRPYPHIGKKQVKNSAKIIRILRSIENKIAAVILEPETMDETLKCLDKADKLLGENIALSKIIIESISDEMIEINVRLNRDYSRYSYENGKMRKN